MTDRGLPQREAPHHLGDWWDDMELDDEGTGDGPVGGALISWLSWVGTGLELGLEFLDGETVVPDDTSPVGGVSFRLLFSAMEERQSVEF